MNICRFSVVRPVATLVLVFLLIVFGLISLQRLTVREYPDIDIPTVSIRTFYAGASASVIESKITQRIEDTIAGIDGLEMIESSSKDGESSVMLEFSVKRDIDAAANDVRDRVSRILHLLPDEADTPIVAKYDSSGMASVIVGLTSTVMTRMQLTDYADRYFKDRFSVLDGVANVTIFGGQEQSMRIWLKPASMAARGVTVEDIESALLAENMEYPAGRIESVEREFTVRVARQYFTAEDFSRLVVKRQANGDFIRMGDVADVRLEPKLTRSQYAYFGQSGAINDGEASVGLGIYRQSKGNALVISKGAIQLVEEFNKTLPEGMSMFIRRDEALFINESIKEVKASLLVSAVLVVLTLFMFLGDLRASLIPAMTVPIALVSSFTVLNLCGFSINILTLLALVLSIGMVVDDAIVVLENVHRRIGEGEPPLTASARGASQVLLAVISTTAVLVAVFLPISLWKGKTGKMFTEFAVAMSAAVCFSSLVALTLTPLLCSRLLKSGATEGSLVGRAVDWTMAWMERGYRVVLGGITKVKIFTTLFFAVVCLFVAWGWRVIPAEFEPFEDRGVFFVQVEAPEGTGFYAMSDMMKELAPVTSSVFEDHEFKSGILILPMYISGANGPVNSARLILDFTPWRERSRTSKMVVEELRQLLGQGKMPGARVLPDLPAGIGTRGKPVQFVIGGPDYKDLVEWRDTMMAKIKSYPGFVDVNYDYKETTPQFHVQINSERAAELGVPASAVGAAMEILLGSKRVTTFVDRGKEYDVMLQATLDQRGSPTDLANIYVRSKTTGTPVPLDNLVTIKEVGDAATLNRFNRVRAITITGNAAPGYSLGQVLEFLKKTADDELPPEKQLGYKGQSKDFMDTSGSMMFVFALALLIAYLVLAAQFESFISPLIVLLTVPLGMIGALAGLWFTGATMNIYSQIGIIMLIGLAAKNGILIVEFANQLRDEGVEFRKALIDASCLRLRPILMTGISTVFGAIPLLLAQGAGAASRRCLGAVVVYGGTSACFLTLIVVPTAYLLLAKWQKPPHAKEHELQEEEKRYA
ncbi:MAG: efflux RND transporter permease subunit [Kiritimatiellaeota bacterium]|nr:efflux RND transporter permease subunit [Kiritimatiellota bacterium]